MMRVNADDLEVGDVFYECQYGINLHMVVTEAVVFQNNRWTWKAIADDGKAIDYLTTKGYEHYGPKLYSMPAYVWLDWNTTPIESKIK
jgi:hypothetical protein